MGSVRVTLDGKAWGSGEQYSQPTVDEQPIFPPSVHDWESVGQVLERIRGEIAVNEKSPARRRDWGRLLLFGLTVVILLAAAFRVYATVIRPDWAGLLGNDLIHYELAVDRWLATGSPYAPHEVQGPFEYGPETFLHPPISLPFFLLWKVIPWPLYWIVPILTVGYVVWSFRPKPWTWPLMALPLVRTRLV